MPEGQRPAIKIEELLKLGDQDRTERPRANLEEVHDYAIAALVVLRGLRRGDKLRVVTRMRRLLG